MEGIFNDILLVLGIIVLMITIFGFIIHFTINNSFFKHLFHPFFTIKNFSFKRAYIFGDSVNTDIEIISKRKNNFNIRLRFVFGELVRMHAGGRRTTVFIEKYDISKIEKIDLNPYQSRFLSLHLKIPKLESIPEEIQSMMLNCIDTHTSDFSLQNFFSRQYVWRIYIEVDKLWFWNKYYSDPVIILKDISQEKSLKSWMSHNHRISTKRFFLLVLIGIIAFTFIIGAGIGVLIYLDT
ncbi:hypothetical protein LAT59_00330 [Candidatus Gracilibacteria bacterium]|nr:hypothetical protein [Candidatus Gracilibacteria bacterium]